MTENEKKEEVVDKLIDKDLVIQSIVDLVNYNTETEIGITLNVGGHLVSGTIVSGKIYFEAFTEEFTKLFADDSKETANNFCSKFSEIYSKESLEKVRKLPYYIHLKDAQVFHNVGTPIPSNKGSWWRGKISEVQGFILGRLEKS